MIPFISYKDRQLPLLHKIVRCDHLHARWLNTLSYLENCGARKIAACQHPTLVQEEMLKHAAEEFRHAYYLKSQIQRVSKKPFKNYSLDHMLGGSATLSYLNKLDMKTSRVLKNDGLPKKGLIEIAYLLVTHAIERRAEELYSLYDDVLRKTGSRVAVKSIFLEEKEHLREVTEGLERIPYGFTFAETVCSLESELHKEWLEMIACNVL